LAIATSCHQNRNPAGTASGLGITCTGWQDQEKLHQEIKCICKTWQWRH